MNKALATLLSIGFASLTGQATVVIMDASTLNGSFEAGTTVGTNTFRNFNTVDNWVNEGTGFDFETTAVQSNNGSTGTIDTGTWNAVINDNFGDNGVSGNLASTVIHTVATGYSLQEGDYFNVSFDWRDASGWQNGDEAIVRLISWTGVGTPGDNTGVAWSFTLSDTRGGGASATWRSVSGTSHTVGAFASSNGGQLYIQAYGVTGAFGTEGDFARLDNIVVTQVPEPSTFALLGGVLALAFVVYRRRR